VTIELFLEEKRGSLGVKHDKLGSGGQAAPHGNKPEGEAARLLGQGNTSRTKEGALWFLLTKCLLKWVWSLTMCGRWAGGELRGCIEPAASC
jgi:hypothetical protein